VSDPGALRLKVPAAPAAGGVVDAGEQVIVNELLGVIVGLLHVNAVCANVVPADSAANATHAVDVRRRRFSSEVCMSSPFRQVDPKMEPENR